MTGFKVLHLMRPFQPFMPEIEAPLRKVSVCKSHLE